MTTDPRTPQAMTPPYAHRNGECEKPTVAGDFGFRPAGRTRGGWIVHVVEYAANDLRQYNGTHHDEEYTDLPDGQYWGPLVGPWSEDGKTN